MLKYWINNRFTNSNKIDVRRNMQMYFFGNGEKLNWKELIVACSDSVKHVACGNDVKITDKRKLFLGWTEEIIY